MKIQVTLEPDEIKGAIRDAQAKAKRTVRGPIELVVSEDPATHELRVSAVFDVDLGRGDDRMHPGGS